MRIDENTIKDKKEIANKMNENFCKIVETLSNKRAAPTNRNLQLTQSSHKKNYEYNKRKWNYTNNKQLQAKI